jgi:hypothetical protein
MMIKILHIPKTAGTTLKRTLIPDYRHHEKGVPWIDTILPTVVFCDHFVHLDNDCEYIFFVRDPIEQFISHFLFTRHRGKGYDTDSYWGKPREPKAMSKYKTLEDFVMDIENINFKKKAIRRLRRSIHETTGGVDNIQRCSDNILFVGRSEYLEDDFKRMQKKIFGPDFRTLLTLETDYQNRAPSKVRREKKLSGPARAKLRKFLQREYDCIYVLKELKLLPEDYL